MPAKTTDLQGRKRIILKFFGLVAEGRQKEGFRFFASDCRQHNPYVRGGEDALFDSMAAAQRDAPKYPDPPAITSVLADEDTVAVHTEMLGDESELGEGGLRQVPTSSDSAGATKSSNTGTSLRQSSQTCPTRPTRSRMKRGNRAVEGWGSPSI